MILDVTLIPAVATSVVVVLPPTAKALRHLLDAVERLRRERTVVQVVREQQRMAALSLRAGTELSHSVNNGPQLVVRQLPAGQNSKDVTG
jgi:hypothetical protein